LQKLGHEVINQLFVPGDALGPASVADRVGDVGGQSGFQRQRIVAVPLVLLGVVARGKQSDHVDQLLGESAVEAQIPTHGLQAVHQLRAT
jgi:hypothetical protein